MQKLPHDLRYRAIYLIRDYERMKRAYLEAVENYPAARLDGMPKGPGTTDAIEKRAIQAAALSSDIKAIETALQSLPEEYRKPVYESVVHMAPAFKFYMSRTTMSRYRQKFIWRVCWEKYWI